MSLRPSLAGHLVGSLVLAFLLLPVLAVVPASFNNSSFIRLPPQAVSLRWYYAFFADPEWLRSLVTSIEVALLATLLAVVIGTLTALGLERAAPRLRALVIGLVLSPLIVPVIMTAIALYYVTRFVGLHGTVVGLALGHVLLCLPFVVLNVGVALRAVAVDWRRAAEGLGAAPATTFRRVYLPLSLPGVAAAAAFVFLLALGFFVTPALLGGIQNVTASMLIDNFVNERLVWPLAAAASFCLLGLILALLLAASRFLHLGHMLVAR